MKKIGLWMAALTAVTVGGVYANFVYSDDSKMNESMSDTAIGVADATLDGAAGTLSVDAKGLIFTIDSAKAVLKDNLGTTNAHTAMISATGSITVTFTPTAGLQETEILNNAIPAEISFAASWGAPENFTYAWDTDGDDVAETIQVFKAVTTNTIFIHKANETDKDIRWTKGENGVFTYTITAEELFGEDSILEADVLEINDIILETYEEYQEFVKAFSSKNLEVNLKMGQAHQD